MSEKTAIEFKLNSVKEKPARTYRKGSKYLPILNKFMESKHTLDSVTVEGKESNYLRTQLKKIIDKRSLPVVVSVTNNIVYLEPKTDKPVKKLTA